MSEKLRRIQTVFSIDDNEHNRKLKEIQAAYKLTAEQIKTVSAEMDNGESKVSGYGRQIDLLKTQLQTAKDWQSKYEDALKRNNTTYDTAKANVAELSKAKQTLSEKIKTLTATYGENSDEVKEAREEMAKLTREEADQKEEMQRAEKATQRTNIQIEALKQNQEKLAGQIDRANKELQKQESKLYQAGIKAQQYGKELQAAGKTLQKTGDTLTRNVSVPLMAVGGLAMNTARQFEDAFVGVTKTIEETDVPGGYDAIKVAIRDMAKEIPAAHEEIAKVVEVAGQLGIKGDSIMDFTKVMIDMGETTNLSANDAAVALAKFANITGMSQDDFGRLGSTIVDLGNNFAATEANIVDMGLRLAAAGEEAGLTEPEILGLAAGLTSVGLEAEAGGSAFSKLIKRMTVGVATGNKDLNNFAKVAGVSGDEFKAAFERDASGALEMFLGGLGRVEESGGNAIVTLENMGISELRMSDATLRAAGGFSGLSSALSLASEAWEENSALTEEAEKRYKSSTSQMEIARNRIKDVGIELGEKLLPHVVNFVEGLADLVDKFSELDPSTQDFLIKLGAISIAAGPVMKQVGNVAGGIGKLTEAFGKAAVGATGLGEGAKAASGLLGLGLAPTIGIAIGAVGLLAAAMYLANEPYRIYNQNVKDVVNSIGDFQKQVKSAKPIIEDFNAAGTRFDKSLDEKKAKVDASERGITDLFRTNIEARKALTDEEIAKIKEYMGLLDGMIGDTAKKYEVRLKIAMNALNRERDLTEEEAAANIATANLYDTQLTKQIEDSYLNKLMVIEDGNELERQLRAAGHTKEADAQKAHNDSMLIEADRFREKEIEKTNQTVNEYLGLNLKKYTDSKKTELEGMKQLGVIRNEEVAEIQSYNKKKADLWASKLYTEDEKYAQELILAGAHRMNMEKIKLKENGIWDENKEKVAGALMEQVTTIIARGGEINDETANMVNGIISTMGRAEDGGQAFKDMIQKSADAIIEGNPELTAEANRLVSNFNTVLAGLPEGKYENAEAVMAALTDGIESNTGTVGTAVDEIGEAINEHLDMMKGPIEANTEEVMKPFESRLITLDRFSKKMGMTEEETAKKLGEIGEQFKLTSTEVMVAVDAWGGSIDDFATEHQKNIDEITESVNKFADVTTNGFKRVEQGSTVSLKEWKKNMEANQKATDDWQKNTKILMESGVNEGVIKYLAQLGPEGAKQAEVWVKELRKMNGGTETEFGNLNEKTSKFLVDFNDVYTQGLFDANEAAKFQHEANDYGGQGAYMIGQFIAGMIAELPYMKEMAEKMGYQGGIFTMYGVERAEPEARKAAGNLSDAIIDETADLPAGGFKNGEGFGGGITKGINSKTPEARKSAETLKNKVIDEFTGIRSKMSGSGENFDRGVADGIYDGTYLAERAAAWLAGRTKGKFDQTLEMQSPSRAMKRSGKYIAQGVALGIEDDADMVDKAMQKLAAIPLNAELKANPHLSQTTDNSKTFSPTNIQTTNHIVVNATVSGVQDYDLLGRTIDKHLSKQANEIKIVKGA